MEPFDGLLYRSPFRTSSPITYGRAKPRPERVPSEAEVDRLFTLVALLDHVSRDEGSSKATMVELRGFEPLTPSMRTRCATRLRHSPENGKRQVTTRRDSDS
jgi:hypothetical protein